MKTKLLVALDFPETSLYEGLLLCNSRLIRDTGLGSASPKQLTFGSVGSHGALGSGSSPSELTRSGNSWEKRSDVELVVILRLPGVFAMCDASSPNKLVVDNFTSSFVQVF